MSILARAKASLAEVLRARNRPKAAFDEATATARELEAIGDGRPEGVAPNGAAASKARDALRAVAHDRGSHALWLNLRAECALCLLELGHLDRCRDLAASCAAAADRPRRDGPPKTLSVRRRASRRDRRRRRNRARLVRRAAAGDDDAADAGWGRIAAPDARVSRVTVAGNNRRAPSPTRRRVRRGGFARTRDGDDARPRARPRARRGSPVPRRAERAQPRGRDLVGLLLLRADAVRRSSPGRLAECARAPRRGVVAVRVAHRGDGREDARDDRDAPGARRGKDARAGTRRGR